MFLALEGVDGSGKTTIREHIAEWFRTRGREVVVTREPGGTPEAESIRSLILRDRGPDEEPMTPMAKTLLFMAARQQHLSNMIRPSLAAGKVVISDRFCDSTFAYQSYEGVDLDLLIDLHEMVFEAIRPDLTIVLDGDPAVFRKRMVDRDGENYYDRMPPNFHRHVRSLYQLRVEESPHHYALIDAEQPPEQVFSQVIPHLMQVEAHMRKRPEAI